MKKNVIKGTSICVLLFLVTATNLMAQHICGTVTDMQNQPIGFANIVLLSTRDSSFIHGSISEHIYNKGIFHRISNHISKDPKQQKRTHSFVQ